jgi:hypothetical protein
MINNSSIIICSLRFGAAGVVLSIPVLILCNATSSDWLFAYFVYSCLNFLCIMDNQTSVYIPTLFPVGNVIYKLVIIMNIAEILLT